MQAAQEASEAYTAKKKAENTVKKESAKLEELQKRKSDAVVQGNKALVATLDAKIQKQKEDVDNANKALKLIKTHIRRALIHWRNMRVTLSSILSWRKRQRVEMQMQSKRQLIKLLQE